MELDLVREKREKPAEDFRNAFDGWEPSPQVSVRVVVPIHAKVVNGLGFFQPNSFRSRLVEVLTNLVDQIA